MISLPFPEFLQHWLFLPLLFLVCIYHRFCLRLICLGSRIYRRRAQVRHQKKLRKLLQQQRVNEVISCIAPYIRE